MSLISRLIKPRVYPEFYNVSNRSAINVIRHFCSSNSMNDDNPSTDSLSSIDQMPKNAENTPNSEAGIGMASQGSEFVKNKRNTICWNSEYGNLVNITVNEIRNLACTRWGYSTWTSYLKENCNLPEKLDENFVLDMLEYIGDAKSSLKFFLWVEWSGFFNHTRDTHMMMFDVLFQDSKLDFATNILMHMPVKGLPCDEDKFVVLIDSYLKKGCFKKALWIFKRMTELGVARSANTYDALFKPIVRRGKYVMALRYYSRMIQEGIAPTKRTFNLLLWGLLHCTREETAKKFYEDMKSRGVMPDAVTCDTLVNGFYRMKRISEAEKFFMEMKGCGVAPTVSGYNTMIKCYLSSGRVKEASRMFEEMMGLGINPDAVTYTTLLPALCDEIMMPEADMVLKDMLERRICPNDNSIFIKLLTCQCKSGNVDAASDVLKAMIEFNIPTEAGQYGIIIENFFNTEAYDRAVNLLYELMKKEISPKSESTLEVELSSYNTVIEYLSDNGKAEKAEKLFIQLMLKGFYDSLPLNNLIHGHLKEGNPEAAFYIHKIMIRRGVSSAKSDSYRLLISSLVKKGKTDEAKLVLDSMIENGHYPDSSLFIMVIDGFCKHDQVQTASRVMKTMLETGVKDKMDLAANIPEALFMRGHVKEVLGVIELLMRSGCVDIDHLLSVWTEKGNTIAALILLEFALDKDFTLDLSSYDKVLNSLLPPGKTFNFYSILCKISSNGIVSTDRKNIKSLIKMLIEEGNYTKRADILARLMMADNCSQSY